MALSRRIILFVVGTIGLFLIIFFVVPRFIGNIHYQTKVGAAVGVLASSTNHVATNSEEVTTSNTVVTHLPTPKIVKGIYMTSWVAGTHDFRDRVINVADTTEANSIVVDIKDYTGQIAYEPVDPALRALGTGSKRIADVRALTTLLHQKGIYVIGRVAVFQDPFMVKAHPEWAVKRASDGGVWKDRKGISWIDVDAPGYWDYILAIAKDAHDNEGFDEINFDYIRFPSDGNMKDIAFPYAGTTPKAVAIKKFFEYIHEKLAGTGIITSADLFGLVTTANDDLGIGQVLDNALPYFDYIDPMVYPSHFASGYDNFKNPADHPYDVIKKSMGSAVTRANDLASTTGSSPAEMRAKLRPWLQDFNLGAIYTAAMIRAQIQATYDVGLTSWLIWDPNNKYTKGALESN